MEILSDVAKLSAEQVASVLAEKIGSSAFGCGAADRAIILDRCGTTIQKLEMRLIGAAACQSDSAAAVMRPAISCSKAA